MKYDTSGSRVSVISHPVVNKDNKGKGKAKAEPRTEIVCYDCFVSPNMSNLIEVQQVQLSFCRLFDGRFLRRSAGRRKPDIKPGVQVKRLFWNSFRVDSERNTVWNEIDREGARQVSMITFRKRTQSLREDFLTTWRHQRCS